MTELTPEVLARIDAILGSQAKAAKPQPTVVSHSTEEEYWHISYGAFDTVVPKREASTEDSALRVAVEPLQRWYVVSLDEEAFRYLTVKSMTRNEWCDWVRR
jgi:hypothetical protein